MSEEQKQKPPTTLVARVLSRPASLYEKPGELIEEMKKIAGRVHMVTPTLNPDHIPDFHSVSARYVVLDPDPAHGDVYPAEKKGELAPTIVALARIWAAVGGTWDPVHSRRIDDGSDAHYCHYRAVGHVPQLDGSRRTLMAEKEIDLRDGSALSKSMKPGQVGRAREHVLAMCESKARNRVIRSLGMRQSYTPQEIANKPFVCLSLVFTGRSDDPDLQRLAKEKMIDAALQTSRELYPSERPAIDVTPAFDTVPHSPPPLKLEAVETLPDDDEGDTLPEGGELDIPSDAA